MDRPLQSWPNKVLAVGSQAICCLQGCQGSEDFDQISRESALLPKYSKIFVKLDSMLQMQEPEVREEGPGHLTKICSRRPFVQGF